ncbi:hypothetical protein [Solibacillus cecembensis]|uniref:hypothetical protein n=1 Tax=Solibacillus cecembensis TaxID=459347 RepID=UPI0007171338
MKKLSAVMLAFALVFSSVGSTLLFANDAQTVEAKSYKSGKKGFNNSNNNSNIQKKDDATSPTTAKQNNGTTTKQDTAKKSSGGLMKGLMLGGLAGLLFGSLFGGMGMLGSILGFMINMLAIGAVVFFLVKIYQLIKRKKEKEVAQSWKN